jgi:hypothetical protein
MPLRLVTPAVCSSFTIGASFAALLSARAWRASRAAWRAALLERSFGMTFAPPDCAGQHIQCGAPRVGRSPARGRRPSRARGAGGKKAPPCDAQGALDEAHGTQCATRRKVARPPREQGEPAPGAIPFCSVGDLSLAVRSICSKIKPPKLCTTKEISPCFKRSSERSSARMLLARSTSGIELPRHRVGDESCSALQTPSLSMSDASQRGQTSGRFPEDIQTFTLARRKP